MKSSSTSRGQKTLKPLLEIGAAVYSAYWSVEDDPSRLSPPEWFPGVVSSYRSKSKHASRTSSANNNNHNGNNNNNNSNNGNIGGRSSSAADDGNTTQQQQQRWYGHVRYYDVHFDDGDEIKDVPDHFIMGAEEYLLNLRHDDDDRRDADNGDNDDEDDDDNDGDNADNNRNDAIGDRKGGGGPQRRRKKVVRGSLGGDAEFRHNKGSGRSSHHNRWRGVRNVTDRTSGDMWARHVGWYVATVDDVEHAFSLLSDALRAYDSHAVRRACQKGGKGPKDLPGELNLPEEWEFLQDHHHRRDREEDRRALEEATEEARESSFREGVEQGVAEAHERHEEDLRRQRRVLEEEHGVALEAAVRDAVREAVKEAVSKERKRVCKLQAQLRRELESSHRAGMEAAESRHEEERGRLRARADQLEEEARRKERREEREARRAQNHALKPDLEVGDEVYAVRWPDHDIDRKEPAGWRPGRIRGYREVRSSATAEDESATEEDREEVRREDYGPVRLYSIKYDSDGVEAVDVPEHLVFPLADYVLSASRCCRGDGIPPQEWKGVRNVVDRDSCDEYARSVGWYAAQVDGREASFAGLADALRAHDASVVRRRGERTKRAELNLPEEWEWLLGGESPRQKASEAEESRSEEEELREKISAAKHKLERRLRRKHGEEKDLLERRMEEDREVAVREAVRDAVRRERRERVDEIKRLRRELAQEVEKRKSKASQEAAKEARTSIERKSKSLARKAQEDGDLAVERARAELQQQFRHEKEKAVYWLRVEMLQRQQTQLSEWKAELERSLDVEVMLETQRRLQVELMKTKAKLLEELEGRFEMQRRQESELARLEAKLAVSLEGVRDQGPSRENEDSRGQSNDNTTLFMTERPGATCADHNPQQDRNQLQENKESMGESFSGIQFRTVRSGGTCVDDRPRHDETLAESLDGMRNRLDRMRDRDRVRENNESREKSLDGVAFPTAQQPLRMLAESVGELRYHPRENNGSRKDSLGEELLPLAPSTKRAKISHGFGDVKKMGALSNVTPPSEPAEYPAKESYSSLLPTPPPLIGEEKQELPPHHQLVAIGTSHDKRQPRPPSHVGAAKYPVGHQHYTRPKPLTLVDDNPEHPPQSPSKYRMKPKHCTRSKLLPRIDEKQGISPQHHLVAVDTSHVKHQPPPPSPDGTAKYHVGHQHCTRLKPLPLVGRAAASISRSGTDTSNDEEQHLMPPVQPIRQDQSYPEDKPYKKQHHMPLSPLIAAGTPRGKQHYPQTQPLDSVGTSYDKRQLPPPPPVDTANSPAKHPHYTRSKGRSVTTNNNHQSSRSIGFAHSNRDTHSNGHSAAANSEDQSAGENTTEKKRFARRCAASEENDDANAHRHAIDALLGAAERMGPAKGTDVHQSDTGDGNGGKQEEEMQELCLHLIQHLGKDARDPPKLAHRRSSYTLAKT